MNLSQKKQKQRNNDLFIYVLIPCLGTIAILSRMKNQCVKKTIHSSAASISVLSVSLDFLLSKSSLASKYQIRTKKYTIN